MRLQASDFRLRDLYTLTPDHPPLRPLCYQKSTPKMSSSKSCEEFQTYAPVGTNLPLIAVPRRFAKKNLVFVVGRSSLAPMSSAAPKKKAFDRGGPVWPPRSNAKDDRMVPKKAFDRGGPVWSPWSNAKDNRLGGLGGPCPPQPKTGGSGGQHPPTKTEKNRTIF